MPVSDPRGAEDWRPAAQPVEKHSLDEIARRLAELDRAARAGAAEAAASGEAEPGVAKEDPFARIEARLKSLGEELDRRARQRREAAMPPSPPSAPPVAQEAAPAEVPAISQEAVPEEVAAAETAPSTEQGVPVEAAAAEPVVDAVEAVAAVPAAARPVETVAPAAPKPESTPTAATSGAVPPSISLKAALAEILGRQRRLDVEPSPATVTAIRPQRPSEPVPELVASAAQDEPDSAAAAPEAPSVPAVPTVVAPAAANPAPAAAAAPAPSALERQIGLLTAQVQALRPERTEAAMAGLRGEVEQVRTALAVLPSGSAIEALSASIGKISARLDETPSSRRVEELGAVLDGFRERLGALATAGEVAALSASVTAVGARLEEAGTVDRKTLAALQVEVGALKRGIERVPSPQLMEIFAARIEQLGDLVQAGNQPIVDTLARLERQTEALATLALDLPGSEEFSQLSGRVDALAGRLEDTPSRADFARVESETRALHALVTAGRPAELGRLEAQIETLAERVDGIVEATASTQRGGDAQLARLEAAMSELATRLDRAGQPDAAPETVAALEAHLGRLADHLDTVDTGKTQLVTLERAVHELMAQLAGLQDATASTAERVALETARQLLGGTALSSAADASVAALAERLDDMRRASSAAEETAQARLEAVHETLDRIVQRMAMLEDEIGPRGAAAGSGVRQPPAPAMPSSRSPSATATARAAARRALGEQGLDRGEVLLEPGSGAPQPRPAAVEGGRSAVDFIAAARRAAQAAAAESRIEEENAMRQTPIERAREFLKIGRRPLVLGIAAVVLLVGTAQLSLVGKMLWQREKEKASAPTSMNQAARPDTATPGLPPASPPSATLEPLQQVQPAGDPVAAAPPSGSIAGPDPAPLSGEPIAPEPETTATVPASPSRPAPSAVPPLASRGSLPSEIGATRLRERANAGDAAAQYEIGVRYAEGRGVSSDTVRAARWFEQAAAQNLAPAQYRLGGMYERGTGVTKDLEAARRWYERAAQAGHVKSMHNLAVLHAEGGLGAPDYTTASYWFQKAAERGLVDSQYNLGVLTVRGLGAKRDLAEAYKWFALAADQGDADAAAKRDAVAAKLAPADLAAAKLAAQGFQAKPSDPTANEVAAPAGGWDAALPRNARKSIENSRLAARG